MDYGDYRTIVIQIFAEKAICISNANIFTGNNKIENASNNVEEGKKTSLYLKVITFLWKYLPYIYSRC